MTRTLDSSDATVGDLVRMIRLRQGLGLRALAVELGVSPSTMSAIENNRTAVSVNRLEQIATTLGVPITDFLGGRASTQAMTAIGESAHIQPSERPHLVTVSSRLQTIDDEAAVNPTWRIFEPLELDEPLAAALDVFLERGYHGASMRAIAARAKLSVPGIYHHYASKQQLLATIMDITMIDLLSRSRAARAEGTNAVERLQLLVECLALYHAHRRVLGFIGASETRSIKGDGAKRLQRRRVELQRAVNDEIRAGVASGDFHVRSAESAGRAITSLCTSICQWYRPGGPQRAEDVAEEYVQYSVKMLGYEP